MESAPLGADPDTGQHPPGHLLLGPHDPIFKRCPQTEQDVTGLAFVAAVEPSAAGEPGHGAFDGPAMAAEAVGGLDVLAAKVLGLVNMKPPSWNVLPSVVNFDEPPINRGDGLM
jgi:hypothetical protein